MYRMLLMSNMSVLTRHVLDALLYPCVLQVIYVVALTAACVVNAVNMLSTITALIGRQIFTPEAKWSPLSFMKLTHEVRLVVLFGYLKLLSAVVILSLVSKLATFQ